MVEDAAQDASVDAGQQTDDQQTVTGNTQEGKWYDSLPEESFDNRSQGILRRFDSVDALAKGYINAFDLVGRDKIPMPKTPDEWQEVYGRLGRPEDPNGYEISIAESLPEPVQEMMNRNLDWFRTTAFDLGLNADQAIKLHEAYSTFLSDELKNASDQVDDEMRTAEESLRRDWGQEFDTNMALANRAIEDLGGEALISLFEQNGLGRNPIVVKAFAIAGKQLSEEAGLDTHSESTVDTNTLDDQISEIQADSAYLNSNDPRHAGLVRKMAELMNKRYPEPAVPAGATRVL